MIHKNICRINVNIGIDFLFFDVVDPMNQPAVLTLNRVVLFR